MDQKVMDADMLTWDASGMGRVSSQGLKFLTHEKFDIPGVEYDFIFFEPDTNNYIKVLGADTLELTEEEKEACKKYAHDYVNAADYPAWPYTKEGLYINEMLKSVAEENNLDYTVLAGAPDHPASKFIPATDDTPEHWERLKVVIREDGSYVYDPAYLCDKCLVGYTEKEWEELPNKPHKPYERWDFKEEKWYDPRTFESVQANAKSDITRSFDNVIWQMLGEYTPQYQMDTWVWQVMEAKWIVANWDKKPSKEDLEANAPYLYTFLEKRTDPEKPNLLDLAKDVLANHSKYLKTAAEVNANLWKFKKELEKTKTNEEADEIRNKVSMFFKDMTSNGSGKPCCGEKAVTSKTEKPSNISNNK